MQGLFIRKWQKEMILDASKNFLPSPEIGVWGETQKSSMPVDSYLFFKDFNEQIRIAQI